MFCKQKNVLAVLIWNYSSLLSLNMLWRIGLPLVPNVRLAFAGGGEAISEELSLLKTEVTCRWLLDIDYESTVCCLAFLLALASCWTDLCINLYFSQ